MRDRVAQGLNFRRICDQIGGLTIGSELHYLPEVDSTNRAARDLGPGQWRTGTVLFTDFQRQGRGRSGRSWSAPPGSSLLLSVLFAERPGIALVDYIMLAALA